MRLLDAWRAVSVREYAASFACGAVVILVGLSEGSWTRIGVTPSVVIPYMLVYGVFGLVFRLALATADALGTGRWRRFALACVAASILCAVVMYAVRAGPLGALLGLPAVSPSYAAYVAFFSALLFGSLPMLAYVRWRDNRRAAASLRSAQRAAMEAKRAAAELEMRVVNEALNPAQVVRALREIESLYESDAVAAGARLDALALELRAAIPRAG